MASFSDITPQFNPYIQQLPVEAMVNVGMQKQQQYDAGIQKIQTQIDNVAGLDIMRPQDKAYLQSKLNELGSNLRSVGGADFSNFQLVNSLSGMTNQLAKDKFIDAAVKSTAWDKQQRILMDEEKKKGNLTPDNQAHYNKQLNNYYNSGLGDEDGNPITFSGSYIPHFDVFKFAKETFDAVKPDGLSWDQVYETDANGNPKIDRATGKPIYSPVMIRMEKEGIFPQKVKETLNQIFSDPRVSQQLRITGEYNYSGVDSSGLVERLNSQQEEVMSSYNEMMTELVAKKNLSKDKEGIQKQIDELQLKINDATTAYDSLKKAAQDNPDYIRGVLYKDDVSHRYTTMFGYTKQKTLTMDNPGWKANFELQKEANEQSRWETRLKFDEKWKLLEYDQKERLAKKKLGGDIKVPEQGDQQADIDVVNKLDSDYKQSAEKFTTGSNEFVWEMVFSKLPENNKLINELLEKGNTREQAISILIDRAAKANKMTPEEYRASWGSWAEKQVNAMKPGEITPELKDAYTIFKSVKKQFDNMSAIKSQIDKVTEEQLGEMGKEISTADIKPQKVRLYGKDYTLSKDDIYDLAVYLKGHQSSLGFLNDEGARKAAASAEARIKARGNEPFLEALLRNNVASGGPLGVITMAQRLFGSWSRFASNVTDNFRNDSDLDVDFSQVDKVYKIIDNENYNEGLKKKAEVIKNIYGIKPNVKMGLLTGDAETDKSTIYDLKRFAGAYTDGQKQNLSGDFSTFATSLNKDLDKLSLEAQVVMDANNNPQIEIVSYDTDGSRAGSMTIQPDEATAIGIDINTLYEPKEVSIMRNYLKTRNNQTSSGDPKDVSTYVSGDAYFEKPDFINMRNTPYDIKANVRYTNGRYYSYIYVSDGTKKDVYVSPGLDNLTDVYKNLIENTTPAWAEAILSKK